MKFSWWKPTSRTLLGSLLALALTLHSAAENAYPYKDIDYKHWAAQPAYLLGKYGYMPGLKEDVFGGEVALSRYQLALILNKLLGSREVSNSLVVVFTDIGPGHKYYEEISRVTRSGIMEMLTGTFDEKKAVSRQEFAQSMDRLLKYMSAQPPNAPRAKKIEFTDVDEPYKESVLQVANIWQLTEGYGNKSFKGKQDVTRFEALAMLSKAATLLSDEFRESMAQPMPSPPLDALIKASGAPVASASGNNMDNLDNMLHNMESPKPSAAMPTVSPSVAPTTVPTAKPTPAPTAVPTAKPTTAPTATPTAKPSPAPTVAPSPKPTAGPDDLENLLNNASAKPSTIPTAAPSPKPTITPTPKPSAPAPTAEPSDNLSALENLLNGSAKPTATPTSKPTAAPSPAPSPKPTAAPSPAPSPKPTAAPSPVPTAKPSTAPTAAPSVAPSPKPSASSDDLESLVTNASAQPTAVPSVKPSTAPTAAPSVKPSPTPTTTPSAKSSAGADDLESLVNTPKATPVPTASGGMADLENLLNTASAKPTAAPTVKPTTAPTPKPPAPTVKPTVPPTPKPAVPTAKALPTATPPPVLATPKPAPSGSSVDDLARELGVPVPSTKPVASPAVVASATPAAIDYIAQLNLVPADPESLLDIPIPQVAKPVIEPASPLPTMAPLGGVLRNHAILGVLTKPIFQEGLPGNLTASFPLNTQKSLLTVSTNIGLGFHFDGAYWLSQMPSPFLSKTGILLNVASQGGFTVDDVDVTETVHANLGLMYKAVSTERLDVAVGLDNYFRLTSSAKDPRNNYFQASRSYMGFGLKGLLGYRLFDWLTVEFSVAPHFVMHDLPNIQLAALPLKRFDVTSQLLLGFDIVRLGNQKITLNLGYQLYMLMGAGDGNQVSHGVFAGTGYHF